MKDTLLTKVNDKEWGVVNLDESKNRGTHWACYYFDSFGLNPPLELQNYLTI